MEQVIKKRMKIFLSTIGPLILAGAAIFATTRNHSSVSDNISDLFQENLLDDPSFFM